MDQAVMAFVKAGGGASNQGENEALLSCVSFRPMYFKADTVFLFGGVSLVNY